MNIVGAAKTHGGQVVALQNVEDLKSCDPLSVRGKLPELVSAVGGGHGVNPRRRVGGQVLVAQKGPLTAQEGVHGPRDLPLVEDISTIVGQLLIGRRQGRITKDLPLARGSTPRHEDIPKSGPLLQDRHASLPVEGDELGDGETLPGVLDRRGQDLFHGQLTKATVELEPAVHSARHSDGQRAVARDS